ncbi:phenylacetate-CoA oxygenase, PaaJ subunit [Anoxybacillus sp. B7M1]|jgi:ring-1,2-phenylacetyl-CoA epoxidase subunit PaaD|uniref:Phenylacetate-CoA oxygenase subunit PaaJ n=1 Tax=Anoxybacteroides rupiense TaxID=311460 RepID=A0ABD5IX34_9BACL|nr:MULTISPECIES: 1,2-phenylacetyl-CoA epoxidase subunit PaaD [Anoxybacillus]ANB57905.1 phenylacetate-CoA oxygenase, PaaJ subunit [Anoxybacillus sp. B2M1]ANB65373.1 phenylacetate-CoA oxygenase, PaaJ subunit [Anoxybacillus sp. B7M1]KXG09757.1 putative 1,2-phenylacetyl-CoA epoxidase, subunit D [Anoxybacillus sp. P3H1B]MBB3908463.1 ring-1,2-phenylacetyl-CoA epoxidase subunit PaaD [Anoxybacillus rupiensis]MBS2770902.1 phenylacetate-CoA oxygenase subunit PaaJ [Anoxybacillus rupiensis]
MIEKIKTALDAVKDPEIDSVSVLDLGMVEKVQFTNGEVVVQLLPTFIGCPALDIIRQRVEQVLSSLEGIKRVTVEFINHPPWTSERITEEGREKLKEFGIAPPPKQMGPNGEWQIECPYCTSTYTMMENVFGPTACRSIFYCKQCKNPFEALKPISIWM